VPYTVEILSNEDGHVALVRAQSTAEAFALATDEAACNGMVITDGEADIRLGWIRATPCNKNGHETRDGFEWCDGGARCHYAYGKPGSGAFRGAFVNVRYLMPGEEAAPTAAGEKE
jgi:hypothetical protein